MAGRHCEADCIARDMTDALAEEIATLILSGSMWCATTAFSSGSPCSRSASGSARSLFTEWRG